MEKLEIVRQVPGKRAGTFKREVHGISEFHKFVYRSNGDGAVHLLSEDVEPYGVFEGWRGTGEQPSDGGAERPELEIDEGGTGGNE